MFNNTKTKSLFRGVCSYQELPDFIQENSGFYIINTDSVEGRGIHWLVVYKISKNMIYFFDSLGESPERYSSKIKLFLELSAQEYSYSRKRIQGNSDLCGDYCILFAYFISSGLTLLDFLNLFGSNFIANDNLVEL